MDSILVIYLALGQVLETQIPTKDFDLYLKAGTD